MAGEITIPLLPCRGINETLDFYRVLGFEVTYQQAKPNNYAVVRYEDIELHFFTMPQYDPAGSYSTCYVRVPDVDGLYEGFRAGLKGAYGRVPTVGIPRIIPLKNKAHGVREFIAVDPGGNWIRIGQVPEAGAGEDAEGAKDGLAPTKLSKVTDGAAVLQNAEQYETAAKILDEALARDEAYPAIHRVQALVGRAGLAIVMGDMALARKLVGEIQQMPLSDEERAALVEEFERVEEFEEVAGQG